MWYKLFRIFDTWLIDFNFADVKPSQNKSTFFRIPLHDVKESHFLYFKLREITSTIVYISMRVNSFNLLENPILPWKVSRFYLNRKILTFSPSCSMREMYSENEIGLTNLVSSRCFNINKMEQWKWWCSL